MEEGAGLIILNSENKILFILRDDIPEIPFPGMWDLPGGHLEPGEQPEDTVKRELKEELRIDVNNIKLFKRYVHPELKVIDNVFWTRMDLDTSKLTLTEGQDLRFFGYDEIRILQLAFNYDRIIDEFFDSGIPDEV